MPASVTFSARPRHSTTHDMTSPPFGGLLAFFGTVSTGTSTCTYTVRSKRLESSFPSESVDTSDASEIQSSSKESRGRLESGDLGMNLHFKTTAISALEQLQVQYYLAMLAHYGLAA